VLGIIAISIVVIVCQREKISTLEANKTECSKMGWEQVFNDGICFAVDSTNKFWNSDRAKDSLNDYYLAHRNELHFSLHH
jgi:hypothetical protein